MPIQTNGKPKPKITIGLSLHRPELIPIIRNYMQQHDAIFLEEPPESNFRQMLRGSVSIEDYLMPLDVEYPEFSRGMCCLLRELHAKGKKIFQVEPFLEVLLDIHDFFAEGYVPDDLPKDSLEYPVYLAERRATKALLAYYQAAIGGSFEETLAAIIRFARVDAARFRLRDSLRAQALAPFVVRYPSAFIEAGVIHFQLWQLLRHRLPEPNRVQPVFLADLALREPKEAGHLYGPGDKLTLLYVFHPTIAETGNHRLLAARSIVYAKIIEKNEIAFDVDGFSNLRDELACIRATGKLSLQNCRDLFPLIRRSKTAEARQIVADYLAGTGLRTRQYRN